MDITSPFFVVPVIVAVFATCILWATSGQRRQPSAHGEATSASIIDLSLLLKTYQQDALPRQRQIRSELFRLSRQLSGHFDGFFQLARLL